MRQINGGMLLLRGIAVFFMLTVSIGVTYGSEFDFNKGQNSPFESQGSVFRGNDFFNLQGNNPGIVYQPFNSEGLQGSLSGPPVLYGPGGDPIGGLPVEGGVPVLFLLVLFYVGFKIWNKFHLIKGMKNEK